MKKADFNRLVYSKIRLVNTALAGVRILGNSLFRKLLLRVRPKASFTDSSEASRLRTTQEVRDHLGSMRGVVMKLAQMASYIDTRVPEEMRAALSQFQSDATAMSWKLASDVITNSFGTTPERLFLSIDKEPFAAASIGQVHRAVTKSGQRVAVKIQYPQARDEITADLANTKMVATLLKVLFPSMDTTAMAEEISQKILEELDYRHEFEVQMKFYQYYKDHPHIVIPMPYEGLSSDMVLTSQLIEGDRFEDTLCWNQNERDMVAETIFRFVFTSLYRMHYFNGDPHPGNYLFLGGGRVAFLDFGFSREFNSSEIEVFANLVIHMVIEKNPTKFRTDLVQAGLLKGGESLSDEEVFAYFQIYYEIVSSDRALRITPEFCSAVISHSFSRSHPLANYINLPRAFVVVQRINIGMYSILSALRAEVNWRQVAEQVWPFTSGHPTTFLGTAHEDWENNLNFDSRHHS